MEVLVWLDENIKRLDGRKCKGTGGYIVYIHGMIDGIVH